MFTTTLAAYKLWDSPDPDAAVPHGQKGQYLNFSNTLAYGKIHRKTKNFPDSFRHTLV